MSRPFNINFSDDKYYISFNDYRDYRAKVSVAIWVRMTLSAK